VGAGGVRRGGAEVKGRTTRTTSGGRTAIYNFCNDAMSSVYLAATKDRLYCDAASDSPRRRRTQTVMWDIADGLCRCWRRCCATPPTRRGGRWSRDREGRGDCVHFEEFLPEFGVEADAGWPKVMAARDAGLMALEKAKAGGIDNPLDAGLVFPDPDGVLAGFDPVDLADLCGVSRVGGGRWLGGAGEVAVLTDLRGEPLGASGADTKRDGTVRKPTSDRRTAAC
jgi:isoleucyl-tRNA synthetase